MPKKFKALTNGSHELNMKLYGIAFFKDGEHPLSPGAELIGWRKDQNGQDEVWEDRDTALYENDMGGWTGYVCEYPSGKYK